MVIPVVHRAEPDVHRHVLAKVRAGVKFDPRIHISFNLIRMLSRKSKLRLGITPFNMPFPFQPAHVLMLRLSHPGSQRALPPKAPESERALFDIVKMKWARLPLVIAGSCPGDVDAEFKGRK